MLSRRAALTSLGAAAACAYAPSAGAAAPAALLNHPGFRAWTRPTRSSRLPLNQIVETSAGAKTLSEWIGRRPAVLVLWASWCAPCLVEKPHQAHLAERLANAGAWTRVMALQTYDTGVDFRSGQRMLDRLGADALPNARASPGAEAAFQQLFSGTRDRSTSILPSMLLIGGDGLEMGRAIGAMSGVDGVSDYWQDEATFEFLRQLL